MPNSGNIRTNLPTGVDQDNDPLFFYVRAMVAFLQGVYSQYKPGSGRHWSVKPEETEILISADWPVSMMDGRK